jgi:hypothetical protein
VRGFRICSSSLTSRGVGSRRETSSGCCRKSAGWKLRERDDRQLFRACLPPKKEPSSGGQCSHMGFARGGGWRAALLSRARCGVRRPTGERLCAPATRPVRAFAARVRDGCVEACTEPLPGSVPAAFRPYGL